MKCLVVFCSLIALSVADGEAEGPNPIANLPLALPFGFGYGAGAVSSTNVNVPGQFSYSVNSVHPTEDVKAQSSDALSQTVNFGLPAAGFGYNPYLGLRNNFYNPYFGAGGLYSMGRHNPFYGRFPFGYNGYNGYTGYNGYNGLGLSLNYPYRGLGFAPAYLERKMNRQAEKK